MSACTGLFAQQSENSAPEGTINKDKLLLAFYSEADYVDQGTSTSPASFSSST